MKASNTWSKKQIIASIFSLVLLASSITLLVFKSAGAAYTPCGTWGAVQIGNTSPSSTGIIPVYFARNAATAPPFNGLTISSIDFFMNGYGNVFLGRGQKVSGTSNMVGGTNYTAPGSQENWMMVWDSSMTIPNTNLGTPNSGPYKVSAIVTFDNASQCESYNTTDESINNPTFSNTLAVRFKNSANSQLINNINISYGNIISLVSQNFIKDTSGNLFDDVTSYVKYGTWSTMPTNLGTITQSQNFEYANFTAGTTSPTGYIKATMEYAGRIWTANLPVNIVLPPSPTPTLTKITTTALPSPTPTPPQSSSQTVVSPASQLTANDQSCIIGIIGQERYDQISKGASQPTLFETTKLEVCYIKRNNIIPTLFAPIKPDDINKISLASKVNLKIDKLENQEIKTGNETSKVLVLRGKSYPNQQLFLYIFSVPLVITTKADKDGNWVYTLKNPLSPGKHEVYAVVDRGNGNYEKTSPFAFLIGKAKASSSNPNGYSLDLQVEPTPAEDNRAIYFYISGVVLAVVVALVILFVFLRRKLKPKEVIEENQPNVINPTVINTPMV